MVFEKIEIQGFQTLLPDNRTEGVVSLISKDQRVAVVLNWPSQNTTDATSWKAGLIAEAMRQVHRLPEFRTGPKPRLQEHHSTT